MKNNISSWIQISEKLNMMEREPSNEVWIRIQKKKFRRSLIRLSYSGVAASILLVFGVFLLNKGKTLSFSGYSYEPAIEKTEAESFLASITFSNTQLTHYGKVMEGNNIKTLVPKRP